MVVSRSTLSPASGFCEITVPASFLLSFSVNAGSPKPASLAVRMAAARLSPSKFGTLDSPVA